MMMNAEELAEYLGVSQGWVRKHILDRTIPYSKFGRSVRFTEEQVREIVTLAEVPALQGPLAKDPMPRKNSARTRL
jgi:excisionase family DNA binding protein